MKKSLFLIPLLITLVNPAHAGNYKCSIVGNASGGGLVIAPGRNDGIKRLYTSGRYPLEFTWTGTGWDIDTLSIYPCYPYSITAGYGRNDSVCRIYTGDMSRGNIKEYSYNGLTWDSMLVKAGNWRDTRSIKIGNIKNDDTVRVVAACYDSTTIAYTYDKITESWTVDTLGVKKRSALCVVIGDGRNNDTNRVYTLGDYVLVEYTYRNNWDTTYHQLVTPANGAVLAKVKNDSLNRLYIFSGRLLEFEWGGTGWLGPDTVTSGEAVEPFSGDGHNDGKQRIYGLGSSMMVDDSLYSDIHVFEFTYNAGSWDMLELDTIAYNYGTHFMMKAGIVGDAHNDGKNRVYGISDYGEIYEWEWDDTLNGVAGEPPTDSAKRIALKLEQNYPNPFKARTTINYQLTTNGSVNLSVYNIAGQLVKTLINNPSPNALGEGGVGSITWDGRDSQGKPVTNGLYFYCLESGGTRRTKKMILLK